MSEAEHSIKHQCPTSWRPCLLEVQSKGQGQKYLGDSKLTLLVNSTARTGGAF